MTNEEAKEIIIEERDSLKANPMVKVEDCLYEALDMAIKALDQQPCDDCISRQEAISAIQDEYYADAVGIDIVDIIANLPSVTPTRPTGKWIEKEDYNLDTYYECSECGEDYCIEGDILIHKYCPNCGARMTEVESEKGNICDNDCEHCDWVTCPKMEEAESEEEDD